MRLPLLIIGLVGLAAIAGVLYLDGSGSGGSANPAKVTGDTGRSTNQFGSDQVPVPKGATGPAVTADGAPGSNTYRDGDRLSGLNLTVYTADGYGKPSIRKDLRQIKALGSTSVTLVPTWYMREPDSFSVEPNLAKTPTDSSLIRAIARARKEGLKVILKPHVDVFDESFRGEIKPSDPKLWFQSYGAMIRHYADLAARNGVAVFTVGTELTTMSGNTAAFDKLIDTVRSRFGGSLTYAANWDEVDQVQFWNKLDLIGVDAYYPLSQSGQKPSVGDLVKAWQGPLSSLRATGEKWGKPVIMTEIGYPTQADATAHPFEVAEDEPEDQKAQAIAYEAAFRAFADKTWFRGMNWWSWRGDPGAGERLGVDYTPKGKKAEKVLAAGQGGQLP